MACLSRAHSIVAEKDAGRIETFQVRKLGKLGYSRVGYLRLLQVEQLQALERRQVRQSPIRDFGVPALEPFQFRHSREMHEPGVSQVCVAEG